MSTIGSLSAFASIHGFEGFADADFDAYAPKKWRSNAYTLGRREAKNKLLALMGPIEARIKAELGDLELSASDEAPSVANGRSVSRQSVFLVRPAAVRQGLKAILNTTNLGTAAGLFDIAIEQQHLTLFCQITHDSVDVGLLLPPKASVDRKNLAEKLTYEGESDTLLGLFAALPEGARWIEGEAQLPLESLTEVDLDARAKALVEGSQSLAIQLSFPRSDPELQSAAFEAKVESLILGFLPIFRFIAWSQENDFAHVKFTVQQAKKDRAKQKQAEAAVKAPEVGARVTLLSGLFAGREGYLTEIDRNKAKVMIGPVALSVELSDLKVQG